MSIHKRVLRVTDEADDKLRAHAERYGIGVYDAATALILAGLVSWKRGAESEAIHKLVENPPEPTEALRKMFTQAPTEFATAPKLDPRISAYALAKSITYEEASARLLDLGIRRQEAINKGRGRP